MGAMKVLRLTTKFWGMVIKRYLDIPKRMLDFRGHLIASLLLLLAWLVASFLATRGIVSLEFVKDLVGEIQIAAFVLLMAFVGSALLFFIGLIYQPAVMYDELGGFGDLRLRFSVECQPNRVIAGWVGLNIYNDSIEDVTACYVELLAARKLEVSDYRLSRTERLSWSHRHEPVGENKQIPAGENKYLDIARTNTSGTLMGWTPPHGDQFVDSSPPGTFEADLRVCGVFKKRAFKLYHSVRIEYRGGLLFASCEDLPNG